MHLSQKEKVLKILANKSRREIVKKLAKETCSVKDLEVSLKISQSSMSQHLKKLTNVGLVGFRYIDRKKLFSLNRETLTGAMGYFDHLLQESGSGNNG